MINEIVIIVIILTMCLRTYTINIALGPIAIDHMHVCIYATIIVHSLMCIYVTFYLRHCCVLWFTVSYVRYKHIYYIQYRLKLFINPTKNIMFKEIMIYIYIV